MNEKIENNNQNKTQLHNGEVIIGRHFCAHCGSSIDRYLWSVVLQLEINERVVISARGNNVNKQERIVSLLKTIGCIEFDRRYENEDGYQTLKITIGKCKKI